MKYLLTGGVFINGISGGSQPRMRDWEMGELKNIKANTVNHGRTPLHAYAVYRSDLHRLKLNFKFKVAQGQLDSMTRSFKVILCVHFLNVLALQNAQCFFFIFSPSFFHPTIENIIFPQNDLKYLPMYCRKKSISKINPLCVCFVVPETQEV